MPEIHFFTNALLSWFPLHGRHDLPWQKNLTPYRVWVSEIMLQQTQVSTVIDYYQRFMDKFSTIKLLANASQDEVLNLWSGLGYYARARNLHRCAQLIESEYQGVFPHTIAELIQLPGIGQSTAGAILSFAMQVRAPILDGNVKRVLSRYHAIEGIPNTPSTNKQLWDLCERQTPTEGYAEYNQAIMDMGATVCTRLNPKCERCPLSSHCQAYAQSRTHEFPHSQKNSQPRPQKSIHLLIIKNSEGHILLEKRPPAGIWGGLWSFPECEIGENMSAWCARILNADILKTETWLPFSHTFSHFELAIHPIVLTVRKSMPVIMENSAKVWYNTSEPLPGGVASPISKLLKQLKGGL